MSKKRVLETYVFENTKSIELMDHFEGRNEGNVKYDQILIKNERSIRKEGNIFLRYQLVIERRGRGQNVAGDITFTNFKKGYTRELRNHIENEIDMKEISKYAGKNEIYRFVTPFRLRAQNSSNRTGYGWEWDWTGGLGTYTEGTLYGETTDYVFVGIKVLYIG